MARTLVRYGTYGTASNNNKLMDSLFGCTIRYVIYASKRHDSAMEPIIVHLTVRYGSTVWQFVGLH